MGEPLFIACACVLVALCYRATKRHARELKLLYGTEALRVAEKTLEELARNIIHREGYSVSKDESAPFRISKPDLDGDREVLFRGRWRGDERMKLTGDDEDQCYALMWRSEGTSYVGSGW